VAFGGSSGVAVGWEIGCVAFGVSAGAVGVAVGCAICVSCAGGPMKPGTPAVTGGAVIRKTAAMMAINTTRATNFFMFTLLR